MTQPPSAAIQEIDPVEAGRLIQSGDATLIDVREPDEHARERIEGARLASLSKLDEGALASSPGRLIVHCRSGRRGVEACARLRAAGCADVRNLKGGIEAWKAAGLPVKSSARLPIPIMRQVQITAGSVVLVGSILAAMVSPWFLILTGFFGAGLLFAGLSGTCGMASMLAHMPWNRVFRTQC